MLRKQMECEESSRSKLLVYTQKLDYEVLATQLANEHHLAIKRLVRTDPKLRLNHSSFFLMYDLNTLKSFRTVINESKAVYIPETIVFKFHFASC